LIARLSSFYIVFFILGSTSNPTFDNKTKHTVFIDTISVDDYDILNSCFSAASSHPGNAYKVEEANFLEKNKYQYLPYLQDIYITKYLLAYKGTNGQKSRIRFTKDEVMSSLTNKEFTSLIERFYSGTIGDLKIDISKIKNTETYKLVPVEIDEKIRPDSGYTRITYSRILYNEMRDKACFYRENCDHFYRWGEFLFLVKENGNWNEKQSITDFLE